MLRLSTGRPCILCGASSIASLHVPGTQELGSGVKCFDFLKQVAW
jgi:hypothetical protein